MCVWVNLIVCPKCWVLHSLCECVCVCLCVCVIVFALTGDSQQDLIGHRYAKLVGGEALVLALVVLGPAAIAGGDLQRPRRLPLRHVRHLAHVEVPRIPLPLVPDGGTPTQKHTQRGRREQKDTADGA